MKHITSILILLVFALPQLCKAQEVQKYLPKIQNYTKGELELKSTSFGENNPITIGKVTADGTIHFNWPSLDLNDMTEHNFHTTTTKDFTKAKYCRDSIATMINEDVILVENKYVYLFKYGQLVGCIIPSTQEGQEHREDQLGSTLDWIFSDDETSAQANCTEKKEWEDLYSFDETTAYDLTFKKGWNMISKTLSAVEEYENETGTTSSLPKTKIAQSLDQIPTDIHWHVKYWANDELLEIEQQLLAKVPITKEDYDKWAPNSLGNLNRTNYEVGKELERMPNTNNINLLFENGTKKIDLTIVDCVGNKNAASMFTLMQDMASRDWKDKKETGYQSASTMDNIRVLTDYNKSDSKTLLTYNAKHRFSIIAEASDIEPEELWAYLKDLDLETLVKE